MSVVVAMSGGVDSSVAALLLKEQGHECVGVSMQLWDVRRSGGASGCCSPDDLFDARLVADALGIPYYVTNHEEGFEDEVVRPFVREYMAGRTPSPCILCNNRFKWGRLWDLVHAAGASAVATGHYARLERDGDRVVMRRGRDRGKDQSYFLFGLRQDDLARTLFPVGDLTKEEVRAHARRAGLPIAEKDESQDVCFVGDGSYADFVERYVTDEGLETRPGQIVDGKGKVLGCHGGVHRYTRGQRRGLGIGGSPEPLYVVEIDPETSRVTVGEEADLDTRAIECSGVNWVSIGEPAGPVEADVMIRYRHPGSPAEVEPLGGDRVRVTFAEPEKAPAPGQAAVFYDGDVLLGGGWIDGISG